MTKGPRKWGVQVKQPDGSWRWVRPVWALRGRLRYARAIGLQQKLQHRGKQARVRVWPALRLGKLPTKVLSRSKWCKERAEVRGICSTSGLVLTSGDRLYNSLASVGRVSDHWVRASSKWADDYWHPDKDVMDAMAATLEKRMAEMKLTQVLVHDAGSGDHLHVAGISR